MSLSEKIPLTEDLQRVTLESKIGFAAANEASCLAQQEKAGKRAISAI